MGGIFGSKTIHNKADKVGAFQINTASYGLTVPVIFGTTRISGNVIDYYDFKAIPHTTTQRSGKGGGTKVKNTTYTYEVACLLGLCEGPIHGIGKIWKDKEIIQEAEASKSFVWQNNTTVSVNDAGWISTKSVFVKTATTYGKSYNGATIVIKGKERAARPGIDYNDLGNGEYAMLTGEYTEFRVVYKAVNPTLGGTVQSGLTLFKGNYGQSPWSYTQSKYPEKALPYSGLAYVAGVMDLGDSAGLPTLGLEVKGLLLDSGDGIDANPADTIDYIINDAVNGVGFGQGCIDTNGLDRFRTFCKAADLLISSPPDTDTKKAYEIINEICDMANTITFWSQSRLKLVPLCDETISANGALYTPNNTPLYDLDEDDFLEDQDGKLVSFERSDNSEAFNQTTIEFINRANNYEVETVKGEILTDIHIRGLRPADTENIHYIHTKERAQYVADIKVMKSIYGRNKYLFRLDWSYCLLEPGDLLTISLETPTLTLIRQPVIIDEVEEAEDGELEFVTIAKPPGIYAPGKYAVYETERPNIDFRAEPGNTTAVIFNAAAELTASGLEVWIAASGEENWGGCSVWISDSGDQYESVGEISGPSRHGILTAQLPAGGPLDTVNALQVQLVGGDQLRGGSEQDAQSLNTLCWVDGELIAYANATLTGEKQYTLTYLIRGVHNTPITPHAVGAKFVRLDTDIFKHPFTVDQIGKTIYLKLTAHNVYGIAEQSLADVEDIEHILTADLPPNVSEVTLGENTYILKDGTVLSDIRVAFAEPQYLMFDHYNIYYDLNNSGWVLSGPASKGEYTIKAMPQAQTVRVKVTTVSKFLLESAGVVSEAYTIIGKGDPPPDVAGLALTQDEYNRANIVLTWSALDPSEVPDLKGYEVRLGQDWNSAVKINSDVIVGNTVTYAVSKNGSYTFMVKAIDNSGNYSDIATSQSITANVTPDAPANLAATQDQKDRSIAVLSWTASSGKDIEGYQITVNGETWFTRELSYRYTLPTSGTYEFSLKAKTVAAYYSTATNTSLTATIEPYDVTGLTAVQSLSDRTKVTLYWDNPISQDVAYFVIKKGVSWDAGTIVAPRATGTFYDVMVAEETEQTFWIKSVSVAGKYSQFPANTTGIYNLNPDPVTNIQISQDPNDKSVVIITWTGIMESDLAGYQVKIGYVWETAEALPLTKELKTIYSPAATGDLKVMIKSINAAGFYSDEVSNHAYITLEPLDVTGLVAYQNGETVELYWNQASEADVVAYEIHEGANFDQGALIATGVTQNQYIVKVDTERTYQYWVKAINRSGHYSQRAASVTIFVTNLQVRNIISTYDEIALQNGTHSGTEFGPSLINFSNIGGRFSDYPTTKFSDVGGSAVLKLNNFPATFSRNSTAYNLDGTQVTANTPRFMNGGIMVEEGTSNLFGDISGGVLINGGGLLSCSIYGETYNGSTIEQIKKQSGTPSSSSSFRRLITCSASTTYCMSFKVKLVSGSISSLTGHWRGGNTISISYYDLGNGWHQCYFVGTTQSTDSSVNVGIGFIGTAAGVFLITEPQFEKKAYMTTWQISTQNRSAEILTVPTCLGANQGTIEFKANVNSATKTTGDYHCAFCLMNAVRTDYAIILRHDSTLPVWSWVIRNADTSVAAVINFADSYTPNGEHTFGLTFLPSLVVAYVDGMPVGANVPTNLNLSLDTATYIGSYSGTLHANMSFSDACFSSMARTGADMANRGSNEVVIDDDVINYYSFNNTLSSAYLPSGVYSCQQIDVGKIITANITAQFISTIILKGSGSAKLKIRTSQDGANWAAWQDFKPAQYTFRYADFRVVLGTTDRTQAPEVNQCTIRIDVPDYPFRKTVTVPVGGATVGYGHDYYQQVVLNPTAIGEGLHAELISKTLSECVLKVKNISNNDVGGQVDLSGNGF